MDNRLKRVRGFLISSLHAFEMFAMSVLVVKL